MGKLLATDLDGTLFYPKQIKRCIPKKNVKFLRDWIDAGNELVLVTSRSHQFTTRLEKEIDRPCNFINCTSSQIIHNGEMIRSEYMDKEGLKAAIDFLQEHVKPIAYLMTTKDYPMIIRNNGHASKFILYLYKLYWIFQFKYREQYIMDNDLFDKEIEKGEVYKVMVFYGFKKTNKKFSKELNKLLRDKYPSLESSWTAIVNEITPLNCTKGQGLEYYCELTNTKKEDVIVIGDSGNDITMFNKFHENSYCMSHAYPSVKKYAKHVVSRVFKLRKYVLKGEK